jgi:hypothetical protein
MNEVHEICQACGGSAAKAARLKELLLRRTDIVKSKRNDRPRWGTLRSALLSLYLNTKCGCRGRACRQCRAAVEEAAFALKRVKAK